MIREDHRPMGWWERVVDAFYLTIYGVFMVPFAFVITALAGEI